MFFNELFLAFYFLIFYFSKGEIDRNMFQNVQCDKIIKTLTSHTYTTICSNATALKLSKSTNFFI